MRLDLNLASHPYENVRAFYLKWAALLAAVGILTVALVWSALSSWQQRRDINRQIAQRNGDLVRLQQEEKAAEDILNQPRNRGVRERSAFLNELIARKAFSWTQVFSDLEKLMPARIRLVSIRPELDVDNQLEIHMSLTGDSRDNLLTLLRRLEDSRHFRNSRLRSETKDPQGGGMQFDVIAVYVPPGAFRSGPVYGPPNTSQTTGGKP